jgi:hypothetical protein
VSALDDSDQICLIMFNFQIRSCSGMDHDGCNR